MNITLTSPDSVASPPLQRAQFFITLNSPGRDHAAGDRGGISGDLTNCYSRNRALCAVQGTQECDEYHIDFTRQCVKSSVTTSTVLN
jgi:hypothetical protein